MMGKNFELRLGCDPARMQTIKISCRCGNNWVEVIPGELHDSDLVALFECSQCERKHMLRHREMKTMSKEEFDAQSKMQEEFGVHFPDAGSGKVFNA